MRYESYEDENYSYKKVKKNKLQTFKKTILLFINIVVSSYLLLIVSSKYLDIQENTGIIGSIFYKLFYMLFADYSIIFMIFHLVFSCYCFKNKKFMNKKYFTFYFGMFILANMFLSVILKIFDFNTGKLGELLNNLIMSTIGLVGLTAIIICLIIALLYYLISDKMDLESVGDFFSRDKDVTEVPIIKEVEQIPIETVDYSEPIEEISDCELVNVLNSYGIKTKLAKTINSNSVIRYQLTPDRGVRVSSIKQLDNEISLALSVPSVDITVDSGYVCVDVPKEECDRNILRFEDIMNTSGFTHSNKLSFLLGNNIKNQIVYGNISDMPHLLIAGTTGSGKSVGLTMMIISLIMKNAPKELGLILIDPKYCEFNIYKTLPHLLHPVVNTAEESIQILDSMVDEMNKRLRLFEQCEHVRDLEAYNKYQKKRKQFANELPSIVIVIDEFADLITNYKKDIEELVKTITAKSRASGIYLILATQRPSVNVITGVIKGNVPSRIAFAVASGTDSRTILDTSGAEKLLGKGDMLYKPINKNQPERIQGYYIEDDTINTIIQDVCSKYSNINNIVKFNNNKSDLVLESGEDNNNDSEIVPLPLGIKKTFKDELCKVVIDKFVGQNKISVSMIQKEFGVGTQRACNIFTEINKLNIIDLEGAKNKPKKFLITEEEWEQIYSKKYN